MNVLFHGLVSLNDKENYLKNSIGANSFLLLFSIGIVQAILKIIKHCKEFSPALVTGQLLGLDVGSVLEVTNCFPFPVCNVIFNLNSNLV